MPDPLITGFPFFFFMIQEKYLYCQVRRKKQGLYDHPVRLLCQDVVSFGKRFRKRKKNR